MKTNASQSRMSDNASKTFLEGCRCGGQRSSRPKGRCQSIVSDENVETPDLAIYSQLEEIQLGLIPSWNSPDITTNKWKPFALQPEATVKVRNLSTTVPAINAMVHYYVSPFGIGTVKELKLTKVINLAPNSEATLMFPLDTATLEGDARVGVHIQIEHPHDNAIVNNVGSQVHDGGYTSESGRTFSIQVPIYNNSNLTRQIQLVLMPTDIIASFSPTDSAFQTFAPHEQKIATLSIQIPDFLHGTPDAAPEHQVTLIGRTSTGELVGGITRLIRIDN